MYVIHTGNGFRGPLGRWSVQRELKQNHSDVCYPLRCCLCVRELSGCDEEGRYGRDTVSLNASQLRNHER